MSKKLTFEFVKNKFEERNYTLLEKEYINAHTKMKYICDKGHENEIIYNSFQRGRGCKKCSILNQRNIKKLDINFIKSEFNKINYELLESDYINNRTKMKYMCDKGHINYIRWDNFKLKQRCPECYGNKKYYYEYIKNEFEKVGYKLLEIEYKNSRTKMKYKCNNNHINFIIYDNFRKGHRCKKCASINNSGENNCKWNHNRENVLLNKIISKKVYSLLRKTLNIGNNIKSDRTYKLLGYTNKQLLEHLESFSNWNELKTQDWHLDHIIPIKAFIENGITDLKIINHLSNLQPLLAKENLIKGSSYKEKDFIKYISKFNLIKIKGI